MRHGVREERVHRAHVVLVDLKQLVAVRTRSEEAPGHCLGPTTTSSESEPRAEPEPGHPGQSQAADHEPPAERTANDVAGRGGQPGGEAPHVVLAGVELSGRNDPARSDPGAAPLRSASPAHAPSGATAGRSRSAFAAGPALRSCSTASAAARRSAAAPSTAARPRIRRRGDADRGQQALAVLVEYRHGLVGLARRRRCRCRARQGHDGRDGGRRPEQPLPVHGPEYAWKPRKLTAARGSRGASPRCWPSASAPLALEGGAYAAIVRGEAFVMLWWTLVLALAFTLLPRARATRAMTIALVAWLVLAGWIALSLLWTESRERTFIELARVLGFAGVVLAVGVSFRGDEWRLAVAALTAAAVGVCALAMTSRLAPGLFDNPLSSAGLLRRLAFPLNYWNALGCWSAMTVALSLAWSAHARSWPVRGAALAGVCLAATVVYLTYARSGTAGVLIGVVAVVGLSRRRWLAAAHALVALAGTGIIVLAIRAAPEISRGTGGDGGGTVAMVAGLVFLACPLAALLTRRAGLETRQMPPKNARVAIIVAGVFALCRGRCRRTGAGEPGVGELPSADALAHRGPRGALRHARRHAKRALGRRPRRVRRPSARGYRRGDLRVRLEPGPAPGLLRPRRPLALPREPRGARPARSAPGPRGARQPARRRRPGRTQRVERRRRRCRGGRGAARVLRLRGRGLDVGVDCGRRHGSRARRLGGRGRSKALRTAGRAPPRRA